MSEDAARNYKQPTVVIQEVGFDKMPPGSSSRSSKPKPSEVAAQTKRNTIPYIRKHYANTWPLYSYLFSNPLSFTPDQFPQRPMGLANPTFCTSTSSGLRRFGYTLYLVVPHGLTNTHSRDPHG